MRLLPTTILGVILFIIAQNTWAGLEIGKVPDRITLKDKSGGRLDGTPWSSQELKGTKVSVIFYVDPDEKDLNNDAGEAVKKEAFSLDRFQSYAIINMKATRLPKFIISKNLKNKQKQYPNTIYVRDYKKVLVEKWGITDHSNDVLAFDSTGKALFQKRWKTQFQ
jgi:predicted transcriptional regulator